MPIIQLRSEIRSDITTCFDLARNIDFRKESFKRSKEMLIAGKTTGLLNKGEWVSWEAMHLGFAQHLTSKIVEFEAPHYFVDEMVLGVFKSYRHEHFFEQRGDITVMINSFYFELPYGLFGNFINWLFLKRYITNLLKSRNKRLKVIAESEINKELSSKLVSV